MAKIKWQCWECGKVFLKDISVGMPECPKCNSTDCVPLSEFAERDLSAEKAFDESKKKLEYLESLPKLDS